MTLSVKVTWEYAQLYFKLEVKLLIYNNTKLEHQMPLKQQNNQISEKNATFSSLH